MPISVAIQGLREAGHSRDPPLLCQTDPRFGPPPARRRTYICRAGGPAARNEAGHGCGPLSPALSRGSALPPRERPPPRRTTRRGEDHRPRPPPPLSQGDLLLDGVPPDRPHRPRLRGAPRRLARDRLRQRRPGLLSSFETRAVWEDPPPDRAPPTPRVQNGTEAGGPALGLAPSPPVAAGGRSPRDPRQAGLRRRSSSLVPAFAREPQAGKAAEGSRCHPRHSRDPFRAPEPSRAASRHRALLSRARTNFPLRPPSALGIRELRPRPLPRKARSVRSRRGECAARAPERLGLSRSPRPRPPKRRGPRNRKPRRALPAGKANDGRGANPGRAREGFSPDRRGGRRSRNRPASSPDGLGRWGSRVGASGGSSRGSGRPRTGGRKARPSGRARPRDPGRAVPS